MAFLNVKMVNYGKVSSIDRVGVSSIIDRYKYTINSDTLLEDLTITLELKLQLNQNVWYELDSDESVLGFGAHGLEKRLRKALPESLDVSAVIFYDPMYSHVCGNKIAIVTSTKEMMEKVTKQTLLWAKGTCYSNIDQLEYDGKFARVPTICTTKFEPEGISEEIKEGVLFVPTNWLTSMKKIMVLSRPTPASEKIPSITYGIREEDLRLCMAYSNFK